MFIARVDSNFALFGRAAFVEVWIATPALPKEQYLRGMACWL